MIYRNFDEAVDALHLHGGGMVYHGTASDGPEGWEIVSASASRAATERALSAGGMTDAEILEFMEDWRD